MTTIQEAARWLGSERDYCSDAESVFARAPEQRDLREGVRNLIARTSGLDAVHVAMTGTTGYDAALWRRMCNELGLAGLHVPDRLGGSGASLTELAIVQEELGYGLVPGPFLSSVVLTTSALLLAGGEVADELLPGLAAGEVIGCLVLPIGDGSSPGEPTVRAVRSGSADWTLTGAAGDVLGAGIAGVALVYAATDDGPAWFVVDATGPGVHRRPVGGLDLTRRHADLHFREVPGTPLGGRDAGSVATEVLRLGAVMLAAEMLGGARRCLDMAVSYVKIRTQFDRPIGSFQAIKHKCADMFTGTYYLEPAVYYAAWALENRTADADLVTAVAKAQASGVFLANAKTNVQLHGGIGYTWEHDAHLLLKRAAWAHGQLGTPASHRRRVAALLASPA